MTNWLRIFQRFIHRHRKAAKRCHRPLVVEELDERCLMSAGLSQTSLVLDFVGRRQGPNISDSPTFAGLSRSSAPTIDFQHPIIPNLSSATHQTYTASTSFGVIANGLAFVPDGIKANGKLHAGDLLVSNSYGLNFGQDGGNDIVQITPSGKTSVFFHGAAGLGLTAALGVLKGGFVLVGSLPIVNGVPQQGSLLILDSNGSKVGKLSDPALLDGPWGLTISDHGDRALVFVSNVRNGTVTRIDFRIPQHGAPIVDNMTRIASGYFFDSSHQLDGPSGLAFDEHKGVLYVSASRNGAVFAVSNAATAQRDQGTGAQVMRTFSPMGLVLAPNGDLIVSALHFISFGIIPPSDAAPPLEPVETIEEFTSEGQFIAEMQTGFGFFGPQGFGIAISAAGGEIRFAAVNSGTAGVSIWTFSSGGNRHR